MKKHFFLATLAVLIFSAVSTLSTACPAIEFTMSSGQINCALTPSPPLVVDIQQNTCLESSCDEFEYRVEIINPNGTIAYSQTAINLRATFSPCAIVRTQPGACVTYAIRVSFYCNGIKVADSARDLLICA